MGARLQRERVQYQGGVPADITARIASKIVFFDAGEVSRGREAWVDRWMREIRG